MLEEGFSKFKGTKKFESRVPLTFSCVNRKAEEYDDNVLLN